nr:MAG TPA: hypothetical protein [Caudoviricetes sp.]
MKIATGTKKAIIGYMMTFYSLDLVNHTQEVQQTFS